MPAAPASAWIDIDPAGNILRAQHRAHQSLRAFFLPRPLVGIAHDADVPDRRRFLYQGGVGLVHALRIGTGLVVQFPVQGIEKGAQALIGQLGVRQITIRDAANVVDLDLPSVESYPAIQSHACRFCGSLRQAGAGQHDGQGSNREETFFHNEIIAFGIAARSPYLPQGKVGGSANPEKPIAGEG